MIDKVPASSAADLRARPGSQIHILRLLAGVAFLSLVACGARQPQTEPAPAPPVPKPGEVVELLVDGIANHQVGPERQMFTVIRNRNDLKERWPLLAWDREGETAFSRVEPPLIDFAKYTLVVGALGMRPQGGSSLHFVSATEYPDRVLIRAEERNGSVWCAYTLAVEHPIVFGLILKTEKPVHFEVVQVVYACG
jgi:hypothetical protein